MNGEMEIGREEQAYLNSKFHDQSPLWLWLRRAYWRNWLRLKYVLFQQKWREATTLEQVDPFQFVILPSVMNPVTFLTGKWFAEQLAADLIAPGSKVLDMGCGSGIVGIFATQWAEQVVSVDINPAAVRCARINSLLNQCEERVTLLHSDLFDALDGAKFDVVLFNPPFFRGEPKAGFDQAWRSNDVVERFADQLRDHLTTEGYGLLLLSTNGDKAGFLRALDLSEFTLTIVVEQPMAGELLTIYKMDLSP